MGIITEKIEGTKITVEIDSTNLTSATYNTETKVLSVVFKNGSIYEYEKVPWNIFTKLRMSDSQGSFFSKVIYAYKKVK